jgi:XTP/dITP diphosphohydrolase
MCYLNYWGRLPELGDAILDDDLIEVKKEELDFELYLVFLCKDRSETNDFDIVMYTKFWKLIHRHPLHIYKDTVKDEEEVKKAKNWEKLKIKRRQVFSFRRRAQKFARIG